tara:strand:- start:59 stop:742 length:684 start_codon:yes stop_codon:yes gene_type:complete
MSKISTIAVIILLGFCHASYGEGLRKVKLDQTIICYPSSFSPDTSFMSAVLAPISDQLDSSDGQDLIYIPASEIKKKVPDYTVSHVNAHNVNYEHSLTGLAYAKSQIGNPSGMATSAWNVYAESESVFIEKDNILPLTRVYEYHKPLFMWHLVQYPPQRIPDKALPDNWYIGSCSESAGSYSCRQTVEYKTIYYEYEVQAQDMHLREEIAEAVTALFTEWESSCNES